MESATLPSGPHTALYGMRVGTGQLVGADGRPIQG